MGTVVLASVGFVAESCAGSGLGSTFLDDFVIVPVDASVAWGLDHEIESHFDNVDACRYCLGRET